jgi:pSer/pThr/pTyr-binding forkhead associated (FHA) protein
MFQQPEVVAMKVTLTVSEGRPYTVVVDSPKFVIGRHADCDLQLKNPLVSRHHCVLTRRDGRIDVADLASRNGTGLNSQVLIGQRQLHHGDRLWIGATLIEIGIREDREVAGDIGESCPTMRSSCPVECSHRDGKLSHSGG